MEIMKYFGKLITEKERDGLPENVILIDVRSHTEYKFSHFVDAISLPMNQIGEAIADIVPDKFYPIIVYCQSGIRSGTAKIQLSRLGYTNVFNGGGIETFSLRMKYQIVCGK